MRLNFWRTFYVLKGLVLWCFGREFLWMCERLGDGQHVRISVSIPRPRTIRQDQERRGAIRGWNIAVHSLREGHSGR